MAKPELGTKRLCGNCGAKFYDLSKDPIVCPKCHSEEVIFEGNDPGETDEVSAGKFNWTCGECGHEWKDDGIEQAV